MEFNLLLEQLRQLKAADQNALDIYTDLQSQVTAKAQQDQAKVKVSEPSGLGAVEGLLRGRIWM